MEERANVEEDKGLELRNQEESGFQNKENKQPIEEEEEKEDKDQNLHLLLDSGQGCNSMEITPTQENPSEGSRPASEEDDAEECDMVKEELDVGDEGEMEEDPLKEELIVSQGVHCNELCQGMEFGSEEAARIFYNGYAQRVGFTIRASDFYRSKLTGEVTSRKFVCTKQGFYKRKDITKRPRTSNREGCKALMHIKRKNSGRWVVVKAIKEHTHDLMSVRNVHSHQSRRHMYDAAKSLTDSFEGVEEAPSCSSPVFKETSNGIDQNHGNYRRSDHQQYLGRDTQSLLEYFKLKEAENPAFFYALQVDEGQCIRNAFWVDARSRMTYKYFSDVVTFGRTFNMNQYQFPFVSFTGLNHHEQTTLFGCAVLSDESESSFVWLFNAWLAAMSGRHPKAIVTSQDKSIRAAVAQVLPKTHHCLCKRNILCEVEEKLAHVYKEHQGFEKELDKCINMNETTEEFESSWEMLLNRYNLKDNDWLCSLYDIRRKWVPVYLRDTFFGGVSTVETSGSLNPFFVGYVNAQVTLQEFIKQYEQALDSQFEKEVEADFETVQVKPLLKTASPIERQAAQIYTRGIFKKFQEELFEACAYAANKYEEDGAFSMFRITRFGEDHKAWIVAFYSSKLKATCSCRMFEFSGILCRHVLTVFRVANILSLPSQCILKRWTRNAKNWTPLDDQAIHLEGDCRSSLSLRYNNLCQEAIKLAEEGAVSMDIYDVAIHALHEALDKVLAAKNIVANVVHRDSLFCERSNEIGEGNQEQIVANYTISCLPQLPKAKLRPPLTSKLKRGREKNSQKMRMCNI